jgi:hypothetical protein
MTTRAVATRAPQPTSWSQQANSGHRATLSLAAIHASSRPPEWPTRPDGRDPRAPPAPSLPSGQWPPRRSHRHSTWVGQRLHQARLALALAGLLVVVLGGPAQAHVIGVGGRASNYRTEILDITPPEPGLTIRVLEAGNQLELTNHSGQEVDVLGYRSEPYLRVGPTGVDENQRSPSAYANATPTPPSAAHQNWTRPPRHGGTGSATSQRRSGMTTAATGPAPTPRRSPPTAATARSSSPTGRSPCAWASAPR